MSNLVVRLITALVGIPVILAILYIAPPVVFFSLCAAALVVASLEFYAMSHPGDRTGQLFATALTLGVFTLLVSTDFGQSPFARSHPTLTLFSVLALSPISLLFYLCRPAEIPNALPRSAALTFGPIYIGASLASLACIRGIGSSNEGAGLALMTMMFAWFSDTLGYFFGKGLKGPKLFPAVSPNKTWSGALGGVLGSILGALFGHFVFLPTLPLASGIALAAVAGILGQTGDFCESVLKRSAGVKDSGGILPGHGGILDRIDALMFAALAVYVSFQLKLIHLNP